MPNVKSSKNDITVEFGADTKDLDAGIRRVRKSAKKTADALNDSLLTGVTVGTVVRGAFDGVSAVLSKIGTTIRKVLVGGLLLFAVTIARVLASIRESVADAIELVGGDTKERFEALKGTLTEIKAAFGAALLPILQAALPYLQQFADWLLVILNRASMIVAAFLGQKEALQIIPGSAAKLAKETEKTRKNAQGALAAFDQINVLAKKEGGTDLGDAPKVAAQMVPITDDILAKVQEIKNEIAEWWADPIGKIKEAWPYIVNWFKENIINPIGRWWLDTWVSQNVFLPLGVWALETWEKIKLGAQITWLVVSNAAGIAWAKIQEVWGNVKEWFAVNVLFPLTTAFAEAFYLIRLRLNEVKDWFFSTVESIRQKWTDVFTGIKNIVKGIIDDILTYISGMISGIIARINRIVDQINKWNTVFVESINKAINAFNSIGDSIPGFQALPNLTPHPIPHLASGAVIPPNSKFLAVLGDQKSGTNVEAPLETIKQAVSEVLGGSGGSDITVYLDGEVIYRNQQRVRRQHGNNMLSGGAGA